MGAGSPLTFLHDVFIQENVPLADALLPTEMETSRSLLFPLNGLLMETHTHTFNTSLPVVHSVTAQLVAASCLC